MSFRIVLYRERSRFRCVKTTMNLFLTRKEVRGLTNQVRDPLLMNPCHQRAHKDKTILLHSGGARYTARWDRLKKRAGFHYLSVVVNIMFCFLRDEASRLTMMYIPADNSDRWVSLVAL